MILTLDVGQALTLAASIVTLIAGIVGLARFIKWWWHKPPEPGE